MLIQIASAMSHILIVSNLPSDNTRKLQHATFKGCSDPSTGDHVVLAQSPWQTSESDVLNCHGIILGTTENFGYMSGAIKDFFERIYYPCLEKTEGKPVALYVKGGLDGQGAKISVEKILTGLRWQLIAPPLILRGEFHENFLVQCQELGMMMAAGLDAGIY